MTADNLVASTLRNDLCRTVGPWSRSPVLVWFMRGLLGIRHKGEVVPLVRDQELLSRKEEPVRKRLKCGASYNRKYRTGSMLGLF